MSSDYNDLEVNFSGNFGHYQNDRVDEILAAIPHETDDAKLKDYYTEPVAYTHLEGYKRQGSARCLHKQRDSARA